MAKRATKVPAEILQKLQKDFELDNYEFADFFGISLSSALDWLKYGIKNQRGHNIAFVDSLLALQWLAEKDPEHFISKDELKQLVQMVVKTPGLVYMKFLPCKEELGPSLSVLKHQRLVTVIMAVLYILHLRLKDIEVDLTAPNIMEKIHEFY